MKLQRLLSSDIYRDCGSLEGVWLKDNGNEWAVTLKITGDWTNRNQFQEYRLFNCKPNDIYSAMPVVNGGAEYNQIIELIDRWITDQDINTDDLKKETANHNRIYDLLFELKRGNY